MESILVLIAGAPGSGKAADALKLAAAIRAQGNGVSVFLVQDAVLCAVREGDTEAHRLLHQVASDGVTFSCLAEDLAMRGHGPDDLLAQVQPSDYGHLVDLMTGQFDRVIGVL